MFVYRMDTPERVTVKTFSDGEVIGDLVNVSCGDTGENGAILLRVYGNTTIEIPFSDIEDVIQRRKG